MNVDKLKRFSSNERFKNNDIKSLTKERPVSSKNITNNKQKIINYNQNSYKKKPIQNLKSKEIKYKILFIFYIF